MRFLLSLFVAILFVIVTTACSQSPTVPTDENAEKNAAGLSKVDHSGFDKANTDPQKSVAEYTRFMFLPLDLSEVEVVNPEVGNGRVSNWEFTEKDAKQLSEAYMQAVTEVFAKDKRYTLVESAGPGVLVVQSKLTRFAPTTPKHNSIDRTPRSKFLSKTSANITLETQLIDGKDKKEIATIIENREMGNDFDMRDITNARYAMDIKQGFGRWAANLKNQFHKYIIK